MTEFNAKDYGCLIAVNGLAKNVIRRQRQRGFGKRTWFVNETVQANLDQNNEFSVETEDTPYPRRTNFYRWTVPLISARRILTLRMKTRIFGNNQRFKHRCPVYSSFQGSLPR